MRGAMAGANPRRSATATKACMASIRSMDYSIYRNDEVSIRRIAQIWKMTILTRKQRRDPSQGMRLGDTSVLLQ